MQESPQAPVDEPLSGVVPKADVPPPPNLARASTWVIVGYGGSQALRLAGNLVLWRLLYAEAFGLMALVNVFIQGLHMFSDVGIGPSIIQNKRGDDPDYLNTAWTIQVARGLLLFLAATVAATPVARFYGAPELASLIPVVALTTIISGFNSTRLFTARRHVALGRLTVLELSAQLVGLIAMVGIAAATRSVWALVAGGIVSSLAQLAFSHSVLPGIRNRLRWERESAQALIRFGRWIFLSTLLSFAVMSSDRLIFGKLVTLEELGVYSIATVWAAFPRSILGHVCNSITFPVLSRVQNAGGDMALRFKQARTGWLILGGFMATCLVAGGPTLVRFLYDERARDAEWMLQLLALGAWAASLDSFNQTAVMAQGRPKWMVVSNTAKLVGMLVFMPVGFVTHGFAGAIAGLCISDGMSYLSTLVGLARTRIVPLLFDAALTLCIGVVAAVGLLVGRSVHSLMGSFPAVHVRILTLIEGTGIFLTVSLG